MTTDFWSITWNTVKRYMLCTEKGLKIEETMNNPLQPSGLQIWTCYMYSLERWGSYSRKTISLQIGLFPQVDNHSGRRSHKIKHSCVKSRHTSVQTDMMKFTTSMTMLVCVAYYQDCHLEVMAKNLPLSYLISHVTTIIRSLMIHSSREVGR